jgi:hypothetical protein
MKLLAGGDLGLHMDKMAGTSDLLWNIIDVIQCISPKLEETELWKQLIFFQKIHFTISFTPIFGHSSRSGSHSRSLTSATCRPILYGRRRADNCVETPGRYFRSRHTMKNENCGSHHRKRRRQCTSKSANHSFTSEGAKRNSTENVSSAKNNNTPNT